MVFPDSLSPLRRAVASLATAARSPRVRRLLRGLAGVGLVLALVVFAAHRYLNSEGVVAHIRERVLTTVRARGLQASLGKLEVDWIGRLRLLNVELAAGPGGEPLARVRVVHIWPQYRALLRGEAAAGSVELEGLDVWPGFKGQRLRQFISSLKSTPLRRGDASALMTSQMPVLRVEDASVWLSGLLPGVKDVQLGPLAGRLWIDRDFEHREAEIHLWLPHHGTLQFQAQWGHEEAGVVELWAKGVAPDTLPEEVLARLPLKLDPASRFSFHARADFPHDLRTGTLGFSAEAEDLTLSGERLAAEPVGPLAADLRGTVRWDRTRKKARLEDAELRLGAHGELAVGLTGEASYAAPDLFRVDAHLDKLPYQAALDALPRQLRPGPEAPRLEGPLSAQLALQGPLKEPDGWSLSVNLDMSRLKETAHERETAVYLKGPFSYRPREAAEHWHEVWVGEKNPLFVPLSRLPPYVYRAVTTSEDGGFFGHHGFDFQEMKNTFVDAAEERRFRGASTITQQLAKNLFLSRERTYARKVQEALVTLALEASLSKQRLLEIYMNIIEWGPGVYGIGEAAQHYFGKEAALLSVKEAAFLATIIPNPIRYHMYFARGQLTENWEKRVHELLVKMREANVISAEELAAADAEPIRFRTPAWRSPLGRSE